MTIQSKFDKGATVWFFIYRDERPQILEATITEVAWWGVNEGFRYDLMHINAAGEEETFQEGDTFMWASKSAATAAVFEANGTVASNG